MPGYDLSAIKILVVDDHQLMRKVMRRMLEGLGTGHIKEAADGAAGLAALHRWSADLVLTDVTMAGMDGLEFVRRVRRFDHDTVPFVPVVVLTGHGDVATIRHARDAGATEILAKPVTANALAARIAEVVERPRPFIRSAGYVGPDRRRRAAATSWRRRASDAVGATPPPLAPKEDSWELDTE